MTNHLKKILKKNKVTQSAFARELVDTGIYKNFASSKMSVYNHCRNFYDSFDYKVLQYTLRRFKIDINEIITFDE